MNRTTNLFQLSVCGSVLLSIVHLQAAPALIQAGPMVGHVSHSTAQVWLRVKSGSDLESIARQPGNEFRPTLEQDLGEGFRLVKFTQLEPSTKTTITFSAARNDQPVERVSVTFQTAPEPSSTGKVRIAFGSCSKISQYTNGPVYRAIAEEQPDMAIFVGDNSYFIVGDGSERHYSTTGEFGDWSFLEGMMRRHLITRVHPDLKEMFRTVPCYAIWDDHDYGPNNADRTFALKEEATLAFQRMWANPGYGLPGTGGIYSSFRHGPAEVFLMDNRSFKYSAQRHTDVTVETGAIWGEDQLEWLMEGLKDSTAPVKIIANGTQLLHVGDTGEGHWQEARGERQRLFDFLNDNKIGGVVFLSGDRHFSEANQEEQPDGALLVECTSSPLQQGQQVGPLQRTHANQLWGLHGNSYGLVTINVNDDRRGTITFEARGEQNEPLEFGGQKGKTVWPLEKLIY